MKRKTSTAPSKIFTYGAFPATENADKVEEQFLLAHRYYNKLVEIEKKRRERYRAILDTVPEIAALSAEIAHLSERIDALYVGGKRPKDPGSKVALTTLSARRKSLSEALKLHKTEAKPRLKSAIEESDVQAFADIRAARDAAAHGKAEKEEQETETTSDEPTSGESTHGESKTVKKTGELAWGTYLLIETAAQQMAKSHTEPRFRRWNGGGRIGVQLQKRQAPGQKVVPGQKPVSIDTSVADVLAGRSNFFRLDIEDSSGAASRRARLRPRGTARLRIGSNPDRTPIWATFPIILHRPLPPDGVIKWAWIRRTRVGTMNRYELQVTVEAHSMNASTPRGSGVVAIDIGWRQRPGRDLRVAYWRDDQGQHGEILLINEILSGFDHVASLRAIQDRNFDEARQRLTAWITEYNEKMPSWLIERLEYLPLWKSPARLATAVLMWRDQRFKGDEEIFPVMLAWEKQNRHLYQWECNRREDLLLRRKDIYRNVAAKLTRTYATILIEDFDLRPMADLSKEGGNAAEAVRANRFKAALSELRQALTSAAGTNGATVAKLPAAKTTLRHFECGGMLKVGTSASNVLVVCPECEMEFDQDHNACKNLLDRFFKGASESVIPYREEPLAV